MDRILEDGSIFLILKAKRESLGFKQAIKSSNLVVTSEK